MTDTLWGRRAAGSAVRNCILWTLLCAVLLMGMCRKADSRLLCPEESGILLGIAAADAQQECIWVQETMGQRMELTRPNTAGRGAAGRHARLVEAVCLDPSAFLPKFFYPSCRLFYAAKENAAKAREYIIPFMHDLDGRKRVAV